MLFETYWEDLDIYAYRIGVPRWLAFTMIFLYPATWAIGFYRFSNWVSVKCRFCNLPIIKQLLFVFIFILKRLIMIILGIDISPHAQIGKGMYIDHVGGLIIAKHSVIGDYPSIHQWVLIGNAGHGDDYGPPTVGNHVFFGPGSVVLGKISVGNNVMIGANAAVVKSVEDNAVVGGVPASTINHSGSLEHIHYRGKNQVTETIKMDIPQN